MACSKVASKKCRRQLAECFWLKWPIALILIFVFNPGCSFHIFAGRWTGCSFHRFLVNAVLLSNFLEMVCNLFNLIFSHFHNWPITLRAVVKAECFSAKVTENPALTITNCSYLHFCIS